MGHHEMSRFLKPPEWSDFTQPLVSPSPSVGTSLVTFVLFTITEVIGFVREWQKSVPLGPCSGVPPDKLLKFLSTLDFPAFFEEWFGAGGGEPSSWLF